MQHQCMGLRLGNANVTTPKSIQTASAQLVQIIANVSSSQYGGCTVDRVDELLVHMHDIMKHITAKLLKHLLEQML